MISADRAFCISLCRYHAQQTIVSHWYRNENLREQHARKTGQSFFSFFLFPRATRPHSAFHLHNARTTKRLTFISSLSIQILTNTEQVSTALAADLESIGGATAPAKNFDPLRLSQLGSDETLAWFRAAELKHSRVAMLATTGYMVQASGIHFPGMLSSDVSFESLSSMNPFDAWEAVPLAGKAQIIGTIFIAELSTESKGTHYTKGGPLPEIVFPKFDFSGVNPETLEKKRCRELNNGRLAMIGIMSYISACNVPGSVPFLSGNPWFP